MPIYKKVDKKFFQKWTPDMAYVLGFFAADGSIDVNPRGSQYFSIQIIDRKLLESIKKSLNSNHKISRRMSVQDKTPKYRLQIGSKDMCDDLRKLGFDEQKTKTMPFPLVPTSLLNHFVRGYFDGDGGVWTGPIHTQREKPLLQILTYFTSCSKHFLSKLHDELKKEKIITKGSVYSPKKGVFVLKFSKYDSLGLFKYIYKDITGDLFLKRKKVIFDRYFSSIYTQS